MAVEWLKLLREIAEYSRRQGVSIYLVGGAVRDALLGRSFHDRDLDLLVVADPKLFAEDLAKILGGTVIAHSRFLTAKIAGVRGFGAIQEVDLAAPRKESYTKPGGLPQVQPAGSVEEDLSRRDFSVNAMVVELASYLNLVGDTGTVSAEVLKAHIVDPLGGLKDLALRQLRILHDRSFIDDPTRIIRGCRYVCLLGGSFEGATRKLAVEALSLGVLQTIEDFRLLAEFKALAKGDELAPAVRELFNLGVMGALGVASTRGEEEMVAKDLIVLSSFSPNLTPTDRYRLLIRSLTLRCQSLGDGEQVGCLGLKEKEIRAIQRDLQIFHAEDPDTFGSQISREGWLMRALWHQDPELRAQALGTLGVQGGVS